MKERPILFSAPMVRAIFDGTKTQTRRIVKGTPLLAISAFSHEHVADPKHGFCPYGQPGDRLWVRETFAKQFDGGYTYSADFPKGFKPDKTTLGNWKPSIHMPRTASRIMLEVVSIRVERLQDINEWDAIAEGIEMVAGPDGINYYGNYGDDNSDTCLSPVDSYRTLWQSINGPDSWNENPFVWVVEFRLIEQ